MFSYHHLKIICLIVTACIIVFSHTSLFQFLQQRNSDSPSCTQHNLLQQILKEDELLCHTAIAINTAPQFLDSRVKDQMESWVPRVCKKRGADNVLVVGLEDNTLPVPSYDPLCGSKYEDNCCKSMAGFKAMYERNKGKEVQWYVKIDDDTFVVPSLLHKALSHYNPNDKLLIGRVLQIQINVTDRSLAAYAKFSDVTEHQYTNKNEDILYYVSGGSGYIISKGLIDSMFHNITNWNDHASYLCNKYMHEDIVMGDICRTHHCQVQRMFGVELPNGIPKSIRHHPLIMFHAYQHNTDLFWIFDMFANNKL